MTLVTGAQTEALRAFSVTVGLTITVPMPDPLMTINWRHDKHWRVVARHGKAQRETAMYQAYHAMTSHHATLRRIVFPEGKVRADVAIFRRPRQKVADDTAIWEALKPIFDGFEDAGVVANDKQIEAGALTWHPTDPEPRIEITLTLTGA